MPTYHSIVQRSGAWYKLRTGIPTASEADKIITPGGKPSRSAPAYMNRLLAEWILGEPIVSEFDSDYMQAGRDNEDAAVEAFEFQSGRKTSKIGFVTTDRGLAGCSPDRLVEDDGVFEAKCPAAQTQVGYMLSGSGALDDYFVQVQAQLLITEREKYYVASFHPKLPLVVTEGGRDEKFLAKLAAALGAFVETMLACRLKLERDFGPFVREAPKSASPFGDLGITDEDLELILSKSL